MLKKNKNATQLKVEQEQSRPALRKKKKVCYNEDYKDQPAEKVPYRSREMLNNLETKLVYQQQLK